MKNRTVLSSRRGAFGIKITIDYLPKTKKKNKAQLEKKSTCLEHLRQLLIKITIDYRPKKSRNCGGSAPYYRHNLSEKSTCFELGRGAFEIKIILDYLPKTRKNAQKAQLEKKSACLEHFRQLLIKITIDYRPKKSKKCSSFMV